MSEIQLIKSADGSHTLYVESIKEHYHSINGALTESQHIFIKSGLDEISSKTRNVNILEVGFGTGLNALLTLKSNCDFSRKVQYVAIEPYPLSDEILGTLNYPGLIGGCEERNFFWLMHHIPWDVPHFISGNFILFKLKQTIQETELQPDRFSLVYFDAFSPEVQPEMWSKDIMEKIFKAMEPGGLFITYSAKGMVRRTLVACGFEVEKLAGPPGKREITRAKKPGL
jgi:tRNA U34 5-methylaminomethyl-2-thiouridine-forming methyltransferase MnmC